MLCSWGLMKPDCGTLSACLIHWRESMMRSGESIFFFDKHLVRACLCLVIYCVDDDMMITIFQSIDSGYEIHGRGGHGMRTRIRRKTFRCIVWLLLSCHFIYPNGLKTTTRLCLCSFLDDKKVINRLVAFTYECDCPISFIVGNRLHVFVHIALALA